MRLTRTVFFDVDFTLIYPGPFFQADGYRDVCVRHGIPDCDPRAYDAAVASASALLDDSDDLAYDPAFFLRYIRHLIERMGGSGPNLERCAAEVYREWAACRHFELYDDVLPAFRELRAVGLRLGLISNTHRSLEAFATHFELDGLVAGWVSSSEHGYNKPHPSIFRTALNLLGAEAEESADGGRQLPARHRGGARRGNAGYPASAIGAAGRSPPARWRLGPARCPRRRFAVRGGGAVALSLL